MLRDNEDLKEKKNKQKKQVTCLKHRKTRVTKSLLVLVLIVIGWEGGAISLEQSQNEVKIPDYSAGYSTATLSKEQGKNQWSTVISQRL